MALHDIPLQILFEDFSMSRVMPTIKRVGGAIKKAITEPDPERRKSLFKAKRYYQHQLAKLKHPSYYKNISPEERQSKIAIFTSKLSALPTESAECEGCSKESLEEENLIIDEDMKRYELGSSDGVTY